jgi:hypothetical protein
MSISLAAPSGYNAKDTLVQKGKNTLSPLGDTPESTVAIANTLKLGLKVNLFFSWPWTSAVGGNLPDMSVTQILTGEFTFQGSGSSVCLDTKIGLENKCALLDGAYVGCGNNYDRTYITQLKRVGSKDCFSGSSKVRREWDDSAKVAAKKEKKKKKRQNDKGGNGSHGLPSIEYLLHEDILNNLTPMINCDGCGSCSGVHWQQRLLRMHLATPRVGSLLLCPAGHLRS